MWFAVSSFSLHKLHLLAIDQPLLISISIVEILPQTAENIGELADEFGYKVGILPSIYLGINLGAPFKSIGVWDGIEERF